MEKVGRRKERKRKERLGGLRNGRRESTFFTPRKNVRQKELSCRPVKKEREAKKKERESSFFRDTKIEKEREKKREREGGFFLFLFFFVRERLFERKRGRVKKHASFQLGTLIHRTTKSNDDELAAWRARRGTNPGERKGRETAGVSSSAVFLFFFFFFFSRVFSVVVLRAFYVRW